MKYKIFLITFLIFVASCNKKNEIKEKLNDRTNTSKSVSSDTLIIEDSDLIVFISPNEQEIDYLKKIQGEDNFYIIADDVSGYLANATEKLDSKKIKYINTISDVIYFKKNEVYVKKNELSSKWAIVYFDKNKVLQKVAPIDFSIDNVPFKNENINLSEWLGNYDYSINISKIDELSGESIGYNVKIKNDSITFSGAGYQTNFYYLCKAEKNSDTLLFNYVKTIEGDTYENDIKFPMFKMYRTKDKKFYINSKLITIENGQVLKNHYYKFDRR